MKDSKEKTNVMRVLDQKKVSYNAYHYESEGALSGVEAAKAINMPEEKMFKTLVTVGKSNEHYVFVIPVAKELDLKAAANAAGEKNIEMIAQKELLPLTGYIHGGCSPFGMKKQFKTFIDSSAEAQEKIVFSAGKIGYQVEVAPEDLKKVINFRYFDIAK